MMKAKQAHIEINDSPACEHVRFYRECLDVPGGVTCDYLSTAEAKRGARVIRRKLPHADVRVLPGPCRTREAVQS